MDAGLWNYILVNLFSMTGRQAVPEAPTTILGSTYSLYDARTHTLYYRISREEWLPPNKEDSAGFYLGWPDQTGNQARFLADKSNVKTNYWVPVEPILTSLLRGEMYILLGANQLAGSFSDLSRLRGQWNNFYSKKHLICDSVFSGFNEVPTKISTKITGNINVEWNTDSPSFLYSLSLINLGITKITSIGVYGPADSQSTGSFLFALKEQNSAQLNLTTVVQQFPQLATWFVKGNLYVQVMTTDHPEGHVRAQLSNPTQTVYVCTIKMSSGFSPLVANAVFSLDVVQNHLSFYISPNGYYGNANLTLNSPGGFKDLYSLGPVYQGFFWNVDQEALLSGIVTLSLTTGPYSALGQLTNWY